MQLKEQESLPDLHRALAKPARLPWHEEGVAVTIDYVGDPHLARKP